MSLVMIQLCEVLSHKLEKTLQIDYQLSINIIVIDIVMKQVSTLITN